MKLQTLFFSTLLLSISWNVVLARETEGNNSLNGTPYKEAVKRSPSGFSQYQVTGGYWNDNFITRRIFGETVSQGEDDRITASFWFQFSILDSGHWWILDMYHNIITNKSKNYRTDLLTLRLSIERQTSLGSIRLGSGFIANNNFGGRTVQNGYHKLFGIDPVTLPYTEKNMIGVIACVKYCPTLWNTEHAAFKGYIVNSYRSAVGPSSIKGGIEFNVKIPTTEHTPFLYTQIQAGYINNYRTGKYLSGLFSKGFTWGLLVSRNILTQYYISAWITSNQYGMNQPHFGIAFSYGVHGNRMTDLTDVEFP